ncbi:unnamed protein product [Parnassius apollo]|uniref:(apollo) hypothetical protein n=1 Tax=Parnassius apollo TaxID=110799 RepID=A0A8S3WVI2_PARAO|nr:unnamed protein product [Parnassius apollo]
MQDEPTRARDFPTLGLGHSPTGATSHTRSLVANEKVEELIDEVQKRPALYKKDLKQYSDVNIKKKLWEEVCEVLISNWAELSVNERKEQGHEIQRKWNNLRTCFARELKAQKSVKSGQAASKRRPYVYFDRMLFLIPCMESRPTERSIENSESNQDIHHTRNGNGKLKNPT